MLKRIIFDIDGTLITGVNFRSYVAKSLKRYGIDSEDKVNQFIENIKGYEKEYSSYDKDSYVDFFSRRLGIRLDEEFLKIFWEELKYAVPKDAAKIRNMLDELSDYELVLLSNYFEVSQRNRLETMGINKYFQEYYGEKIIKPNKDAYIQAKGSHKPHECLIVGDDEILDIEVPASLGFGTVHVGKDIDRVEELTKVLKK